ncbi:hypothetical protein [Levilactobacillus fujinensis]|uniref:Tyr recombinase domain-containing protein n=1 Tax=Levilactobacillus fujinensis TaxID=2486024 RepID=A0ABW1TD97_9LACO|nr:hypothetical protein [Levilactobacillus fujinensis]
MTDYVATLDEPWLPLFRVSKRTLQYYAREFLKTIGIAFHCHLLRHTFAAKLKRLSGHPTM